MLAKVFKAMVRKPTKGDWIEIGQKDLKDFEIEESLTEIANMKIDSFKKKVSAACSKYTFKKLMEEKEKHSKASKLTYQCLTMQNYLTSPKVTEKEAKLLFKIRVRSLNVRNNYKNKYMNDSLLCPLCNQHIDNQENVLLCKELNSSQNTKYDDLFSPDLDVVAKTIKHFKYLWRKREEKMQVLQNSILDQPSTSIS